MAWRLYARRTTTGEWLHTDVPMRATLTYGTNNAARADGLIPHAFAATETLDGLPFWLERGTTLYAEEDGVLSWCGLLDYARPTRAGLQLEFKGLMSAFDQMWYDGKMRIWEANPYAVVTELVNNGQSQPDGNVGFVVTRQGRPAGFAGDPLPDVPRPKKPPRRKGEKKEAYDDRLLKWELKVDAWERLYRDREPYALASWELQYIGDEIAELAEEVPFQYLERHSWVNRDALVPKHELVLAERFARRRLDIAVVEGSNVTELLEPETDTDIYGNHAVVAGAGEGSTMKLAQAGVRDGRVRTTRFAERKAVKQQKRLRAVAADFRRRSRTSLVLEAANVTAASVKGLNVGDEVRVTSARFEGWCRVAELTKSTDGGPVSLKFEATVGGVAR